MVTENPARTPSRKRGPAGNSFCDDSPPSPTFVLGQNHRRIMQNLERPTFCQPCQKPTQHQIRHRTDPDFVGRVLVCENWTRQTRTPRSRNVLPRLLTKIQDMWLLDIRERPIRGRQDDKRNSRARKSAQRPSVTDKPPDP